MTLHENENDFLNLIQVTRDKLGIPIAFIEKDYWITYILKNLSECSRKDKIIFKGGTSLSKAYNVIDRFSEDIDLTFKNEERMSGNQRKEFLKYIHNKGKGVLMEDESFTQKVKGNDMRKMYYKYQNKTEDSITRKSFFRILIESNSFPSPIRTTKRNIQSYIGQMLSEIKREDLIQKYKLESFQFNVLDYKLTFSEKLICLLKHSLTKDWEIKIKEKNRHFYDIYKLFNLEDIKKYLKSDSIIKDLNGICQSEYRGELHLNQLLESRLFLKTGETLKQISSSFQDFRYLLFDDSNFKLSDMIENFIECFKFLEKQLTQSIQSSKKEH